MSKEIIVNAQSRRGVGIGISKEDYEKLRKAGKEVFTFDAKKEKGESND